MAKIPNIFSIFSSKTLKEKQLEDRFERKDRARSQFENNLNRSAGLKGNCTTPIFFYRIHRTVKSVLGRTIRLMNSQAEAKSD